MRKLSKKKKLPIIFFLILGLLLYLFAKLNIFSVKKIEVFVTNKLDCVKEIQLRDSSGVLGQNIFFINHGTLTKKIKDRFYCVKNVALTKSLPDQVEINVSGREPSAILVATELKQATSSAFLENMATPSAQEMPASFLIDDDGVVFSNEVGDLNIPKIFINIFNLSLGQKLENYIIDSLKILKKIKTYGLNEKISVVIDKSLVIFSDPKLIFKLDEKIEEQLASLQLILNKAKIDRGTVPTDVGEDASQLEFIDLRFDKPVVRFAPIKK